jgi:parallel beta-helix repeat protein
MVKRKIICIGVISLFLLTGFSTITILGDNISSTNTVKTIYVNDDNTNGPWDGSIQHPYQYIQDGIDAANQADTVFVYTGIYYEKIVVNKAINVIGENKEDTIVDGDDSGKIVKIIVNQVMISGFTFRSGKYAIYLENSNNCTISENIIYSTQNGGIELTGSSNNVISNNHITNAHSGVTLIKGSINNIIQNNEISSNNFAGVDIHTSYNTIIRNTISFCDYANVHIKDSKENSVANNVISSGQYGLVISGYKNIIKFNSISKNWCGIYVWLYGDGEHIIENNNFLDNSNSDAGIYCEKLIWELIPTKKSNWNGNYWNRPRLSPKPIFGQLNIFFIPGVLLFIPLLKIEYDLNPALKLNEVLLN